MIQYGSNVLINYLYTNYVRQLVAEGGWNVPVIVEQMGH